jgi:hypothetical protein
MRGLEKHFFEYKSNHLQEHSSTASNHCPDDGSTLLDCFPQHPSYKSENFPYGWIGKPICSHPETSMDLR